jgi:NAD/NADP transhydrogenase alpha subunit
MFSNNIKNFLKILIKDGSLNLNLNDEIIRETLINNEKVI